MWRTAKSFVSAKKRWISPFFLKIQNLGAWLAISLAAREETAV
jgi:hypothetical protein